MLPASGVSYFVWNVAPSSFYQDLIASISQIYWYSQTYEAINGTYWTAIEAYCINEFPIINNGVLDFSADRTDCYQRAYEASFSLLPSYSDSTSTVSQIEGFGITIERHLANDPLGNWGLNYLNNVNKVKACKLWFDRKRELGCK